jgi:hypothetical protein
MFTVHEYPDTPSILHRLHLVVLLTQCLKLSRQVNAMKFFFGKVSYAKME